MPGWHEATRELQQQGKVRLVGIIQEQHPDRCRLFMQWKRMDWPILVDSLNLLEVEAVPITLFIDEHGIVQSDRLPLAAAETFERDYLEKTYPAPPAEPAVFALTPENLPALEAAKSAAGSDSQRRFAHAAFLWGGDGRVSDVIDAYQTALNVEPESAVTHFRLGVALRRRYDSAARREGDFQAAVAEWKLALDRDPNQYIWRRRIQQYGPRLDKPYPFYDWVPAARVDIEARGDTPAPLVVEPGGAEFAAPQKEFVSQSGAAEQPDPSGKIYRDENEFVAMEAAAVPPVVAAGEALRVHLEFQPREALKAHWNNEADGLAVWVDSPEGCEPERNLFSLSNPPQTVSLEPRKVEFELRCGDQAKAKTTAVSGYALYYVCEDVNGVCLYRRQDFRVGFEIRQP